MTAWFRVFITAVIFVGLSFGVYGFLTRSFFKLERVELVLEGGRDPSFIFPQIKDNLNSRLSSFIGEYIWSLSLSDVLGRVESDRRIKEAKVRRVFPNTLMVSISPHAAIANVLGGDGQMFYPLSRDGGLLPPVSVYEAHDSPILRGEEFLKNNALRSMVIELLVALPEVGSVSQKNISEIGFDSNRGLILVLQPSGVEVVLGHEDLVHRTALVTRVVQYMRSEELSGRVIDARFSKKVVVRLRNDP